MGDDAPAGKRKRRKYTMSPAARAQRRAAARKTGEYAETIARQVLPSCNRRQCRLRFPCAVRDAVTERGGSLESCAVALVLDPDIKQRYVDAFRGELGGIEELAGMNLGILHATTHAELKQLSNEGFVVDRPIVGDKGEVIGSIPMKNPRAELALDSMRVLGHTAEQQGLTRKSAGERNLNENLGAALSMLAKRNKRLAAEAG